ncbi:hypothetical protein ACHHYP_03490 [Achlya hypogyna]|uniref:BZIP domain-containing protein n=1 Tax=Achlya hypogyna TaxID=1202772 RepID=A0A1V9Z3K2_ACHHY|nr:hypothetical protein ACHHYP_03490 [Achlya hypogyna]
MLPKKPRRARLPATDDDASPDQDEANAARKQRRRDQVRINQRNLRLRQRQLNGLEDDIKTIEQQIAQFDENLQALRNLSARDDFYVSNFAQYLHLHLHGVLPSHPNRFAEQRRISRFLFRDDVVYGGISGLAYIEDQWLKWAGFHPKFQLVPTGFEVIHSTESTILRVPSELKFIMTRLTIEAVYPHILAHEDVVQKILGREFTLEAGFLAYFNSTGQIERLETWTNMATAFAKSIGALEASTLLADSEVRDTSHIRGAREVTASLYEQFEAMKLEDVQSAVPHDGRDESDFVML